MDRRAVLRVAALRLAGALALVAAVAGGLWWTYDLGFDAGRAETAAVLERWKASVQEQALRRHQAQQARIDALQGDLDELRSRPEKIRTVVQRVEVRADDTCRSLPAAWKRLWDADADSVRPDHTAAEPASVDDGSRVEVADAAAVAAEARHRFEINAARLTALQAYVRALSPKEPEQ